MLGAGAHYFGVGAGRPKIDHDRFFKELLSTFFFEFLELFFPKLAAAVSPNSLEFLNQEAYLRQIDGRKYRTDLIVKARYREKRSAFFLVHLEHQSTAPKDFNRRFFRYFYSIFDKHGVPVFPIVIYSHDKPAKKQADRFVIELPGRRVLTFHYNVVQLNRRPWRRFLNSHNPVASALTSKMKIAPRDRPRVKLGCLRLMVTLKLTPEKMRLIGKFVDTYLALEPRENVRFQEVVSDAGLEPEQERIMLDYVTSWERRGIEIGREQGMQEGMQITARQVLIDILKTRFNRVPNPIRERIKAIESVEDLRRLTRKAIKVASIADLKIPELPQPQPEVAAPAKRTKKATAARSR